MCEVPSWRAGGDHPPEPTGANLPPVQRSDADVRVEGGDGDAPEARRLQSSADASSGLNEADGFKFLGWFKEPKLEEKVRGLDKVLSSIKAENSVVLQFTGTLVPSQVPVRCRCPLGARVVATSPAPGLWNVLQIDATGRAEYDLGPRCPYLRLCDPGVF